MIKDTQVLLARLKKIKANTINRSLSLKEETGMLNPMLTSVFKFNANHWPKGSVDGKGGQFAPRNLLDVAGTGVSEYKRKPNVKPTPSTQAKPVEKPVETSAKPVESTTDKPATKPIKGLSKLKAIPKLKTPVEEKGTMEELKTDIFYHGTLNDFFDNIKKNGITPSNPKDRAYGEINNFDVDFYKGDRGKSTYITKVKDNAIHYANHAAQVKYIKTLQEAMANNVPVNNKSLAEMKKATMVVFKIEVPKSVKVIPDEFDQESHRIVGSVNPEWITEAYIFRTDRPGKYKTVQMHPTKKEAVSKDEMQTYYIAMNPYHYMGNKTTKKEDTVMNLRQIFIVEKWNKNHYPKGTPGGIGGRFAPSSGEGEAGGATVFVSPNEKESTSISAAFRRQGSKRFKAFMEILNNIDQFIGVKGNAIPAIGDTAAWGTEESVALHYDKITEKQLKVIGSLKGLLAKQLGVAIFKENNRGNNLMHEIEVPKEKADIAKLRKMLNSEGIEFRTLTRTDKGTKVSVIDFDGSVTQGIKNLSKAVGTKFKTRLGNAQIIEPDVSDKMDDSAKRRAALDTYVHVVKQNDIPGAKKALHYVIQTRHNNFGGF